MVQNHNGDSIQILGTQSSLVLLSPLKSSPDQVPRATSHCMIIPCCVCTSCLEHLSWTFAPTSRHAALKNKLRDYLSSFPNNLPVSGYGCANSNSLLDWKLAQNDEYNIARVVGEYAMTQ